MKSLISIIMISGILLTACGKQKAKQNPDNEELIKLEEEIKSNEATLEELSKEEKELDAINQELEDMLKDLE